MDILYIMFAKKVHRLHCVAIKICKFIFDSAKGVEFESYSSNFTVP